MTYSNLPLIYNAISSQQLKRRDEVRNQSRRSLGRLVFGRPIRSDSFFCLFLFLFSEILTVEFLFRSLKNIEPGNFQVSFLLFPTLDLSYPVVPFHMVLEKTKPLNENSQQLVPLCRNQRPTIVLFSTTKLPLLADAIKNDCI